MAPILRRLSAIVRHRRTRRLAITTAVAGVLWLSLSAFVAYKLTHRRGTRADEAVPSLAWGRVEPHRFRTADGHEIGAWRLKLGAAGSINGIVVDRTAAFTGFSESETAGYTESTGQLFAELGYAFKAGNTTPTPFGRLTLLGVSGGSYSEGNGVAALSGDSAGFGAATMTFFAPAVK